MIRRPPRSTLSSSSAASDVYKRQEWFRFDELQRDGLYHVIMYAAQFKSRYRYSIDTDGHKWFELTESMMAFFLFTHIANPKVCPGKLTSFLELMGWGDIIDACPILQCERAKQARLHPRYRSRKV